MQLSMNRALDPSSSHYTATPQHTPPMRHMYTSPTHTRRSRTYITKCTTPTPTNIQTKSVQTLMPHTATKLRATRPHLVHAAAAPTCQTPAMCMPIMCHTVCQEPVLYSRMLAGILHLGNFNFGSSDQASIEGREAEEALEAAASLLGCNASQLLAGICSRRIKAGAEWVTTAATSLQVRPAHLPASTASRSFGPPFSCAPFSGSHYASRAVEAHLWPP